MSFDKIFKCGNISNDSLEFIKKDSIYLAIISNTNLKLVYKNLILVVNTIYALYIGP